MSECCNAVSCNAVSCNAVLQRRKTGTPVLQRRKDRDLSRRRMVYVAGAEVLSPQREVSRTKLCIGERGWLLPTRGGTATPLAAPPRASRECRTRRIRALEACCWHAMACLPRNLCPTITEALLFTLACTSAVRAPPRRAPELKQKAPVLSRRAVCQLAGGAGILAGLPSPGFGSSVYEESTKLVWEPRGKLPPRSTISSSYKPFFITYLARFLLNYDESSAQWWDVQARALPVGVSTIELRKLRQKQFGQFAESVEIGLLRYQGRDGVRQLFSLLRSRCVLRQTNKL